MIKYYFVVLMYLSTIQQANAQNTAQKIEVFTNSAIVLQNVNNETVYYLDGLELLKSQLSQNLPGNPPQAQEVVKLRAKNLGKQLNERAMNAANGIALAQQYGINRVPAVVINGKSVLYGVTDITQALKIYRMQGVK